MWERLHLTYAHNTSLNVEVGFVCGCSGKPIRTRACPDIDAAYLYSTSPHIFSGATETAFNRVRDEVNSRPTCC